MRNFQISPSLLSADFARLGEEADAVIAAGADSLHLDAMDNHFVPNLTVGPLVCRALRRYGVTVPINVHLMVSPVDRLIVDFANAGATTITFHPEASEDVERSLDLIRKHQCKVGIALNPETPVEYLRIILDRIDFVLVMSVHPGFAGQTFIPATINKIKQVRKLISSSERTIHLGVDGGINLENIVAVAEAGAEVFVAGSAIFNHQNYANIIKKMRVELASVKHD